MAGKVKVKYLDGREVEIRVGPRAEVEVERKYGVPYYEFDQHQHLYYSAWAALHFSGQENAEFDDFLNAVEDIDPVKEPESKPVDPTRKARRRGGTSS